VHPEKCEVKPRLFKASTGASWNSSALKFGARALQSETEVEFAIRISCKKWE
jgi:hypothetical protein